MINECQILVFVGLIMLFFKQQRDKIDFFVDMTKGNAIFYVILCIRIGIFKRNFFSILFEKG